MFFTYLLPSIPQLPLFPNLFPFLPFFFSHPRPVDNLKLPLSLATALPGVPTSCLHETQMKYRFYILVTLYVALASSRFLRLLRAPNSCDIEDEEGRSFSRYFSSLMRRSARLPRSSAFHYSRMIWEASE